MRHKYSFEFKKYCIELYKSGAWPETPDGIKENNFQSLIKTWVRTESLFGISAIKNPNSTKDWSAEDKYRLVSLVLDGKSMSEVSAVNGIHKEHLRRWVRKYESLGYNGLINHRKSSKDNKTMKKINYNNPRKRVETEHEELLRLREEIAYMKAEMEIIKKEIALREEKQAAQLKAKKQRSLKNSAKKDTN